MTYKDAINKLLQITNWTPSLNADGFYEVLLENCLLKYKSEDGKSLKALAKIGEMPVLEEEKIQKARELLKLNASLIRSCNERIVLYENSFYLELLILGDEFDELNIEECFESFLNTYDFLSSELNKESMPKVVPFDLLF